jgi:hypothetical protein
MYKATIDREKKIRELGYGLVVKWESDDTIATFSPMVDLETNSVTSELWINNNAPKNMEQTTEHYARYCKHMVDLKIKPSSVQKFSKLVENAGYEKRRVNNINHWVKL